MQVATGNIRAIVKDYFQDQCDALSLTEGRNILVSHFGGFSLDLISSLTESVEQLLISKGDNPVVRKRIFSILIEGMQNVRKHGSKDDTGNQIGYLILAGDDENYKVIMANLVSHQNRELVKEYLKKINKYSLRELGEKYKSVLTNEFLANEGGSGLGLITTRLKTGSVLGHNCFGVSNDLDLFAFEVILPKN